jgi:protein-disulfide isomerase
MALRFITLILGAVLAAGMAVAAWAQSPAAAGLTEEQAKAMPGLIRDYILNHPGILIESLQAAKRKAEAAAKGEAQGALTLRRDELVADPATPVGGNPKGDVTIVEFFDYRCPYCKQVEPELQAMLKADPKLRIAYKEYPILGPASVYATRMAMAAGKQGKYQVFHDAMLTAKGQIDEALILRVARLAGVDVERAKRDMQDPKIDALVEHNIELAQTLRLRGTPGFVIGDQIVDGAASVEVLKKYVTEARGKSG